MSRQIIPQVIALFGRLVGKVEQAFNPILVTASSSLITPDSNQWIGSGSNIGMESMTIDQLSTKNSYLAEALFRKELPKLVEMNPDKIGLWVLYSKDGFVEEAPTEKMLYQKYGDKAIDDNYFIGRILPEPPITHVNSNWYAVVDGSMESKGRSR